MSLTEVMLTTQLRLDIQMTEDFPFLGNASISFLELPTLDFSISSFGGLELSSIPLAYYWVNATLSWMLGQYTYPLYTVVDLRHNICPLCDKPPELSIGEILRDFAVTMQQRLVLRSKQMVGAVRMGWGWGKKVAKDARKHLEKVVRNIDVESMMHL